MKSKKLVWGFYLQILVTIVVAVLGFICLLGYDFYLALEITVAIDLFVMAYNNHRVYHKKNLTIVYLVVALAVLLMAVLGGFKWMK